MRAWMWWRSQQRIEAKLDDCLRKLNLVLQREEKIMTAIDDALMQAESAAKANADAEDAVEALLTTLSAQIATLKASSSDPATVARIQALADGLKARAESLAAAVVAGTPSA